MAAKFMRIKRIVLPFLTVAILTSQLAGCAMLTKDELLEGVQQGSEVVIEYAEPDREQTGIEKDILSDDAENTQSTEQDSTESEWQGLTDLEMQWLFEQVYNDCHDLQLELELLDMHQSEYSNLPADYQERYIDWRPIDEEPVQVDTPEVAEQVVFTEVNETVYATGTVNIRASYNTSSDKLGSLSKGQSVTRTGIGTGDATGWSRVEFNGQVAYISSQYLSTTKPVVQSNNSGGGRGQQQGKPTGSQQGSSGGSASEPDVSTTFPGQTLTEEDLATGNENPYDTIYHPIP